MTRLTHDIQHDHHGTLDSSVIGTGPVAATLGVSIGRYYSTDLVAAVISDMNARLLALENGTSIRAGSATSDGVITKAMTSTFTASAEINVP